MLVYASSQSGGFGLDRGLANPARLILGEWRAVRTEFISKAAIGLAVAAAVAVKHRRALIANFEMTSHRARRVVNGDTRSSGQVIRAGFVNNGSTSNARGSLE